MADLGGVLFIECAEIPFRNAVKRVIELGCRVALFIGVGSVAQIRIDSGQRRAELGRTRNIEELANRLHAGKRRRFDRKTLSAVIDGKAYCQIGSGSGQVDR